MVTDFHSHILPGVDDGSAGVEESIAMLRMEAAQGIDCVVATPHFYARYDDPCRFLQRRAAAEEQLRETMEDQCGLPQVLTGAEVHYFTGMSDSDDLRQLTIGEKRGILIEMPPAPWTDGMYRELVQVHEKQGLTPVIAHIDRYITPFHTHGILSRLEEMPVLVQANASFFLKRGTAPFALRLLRQGKIHLLGSDCHNLTDRAPNLGIALGAIRKRLGGEALDWLERHENVVLPLDVLK